MPAKLLGSRQDKFAGLLSFIDACLQIGKQGRQDSVAPLQDGLLGKLVQNPPWVCFGKFPLVEILKRNIAVFGTPTHGHL